MRNYKITSLSFMIVIALLACLTGCSGGSIINPITTHTEPGNLKSSHDDMTPLAGFASRPDIGFMGGYMLTISADDLTAELVPMRDLAIGESWIVSGRSYFETPTHCFMVNGFTYEPGVIIAEFVIKHPFEKGDTEADPSARNRLDLNIFDLAMVVVPKPLNTINYPMLNVEVPDYLIDNPAGLTNELSVAFGTETALPYVLVVDDSRSSPPSHTYNRFEMGSSTEFEARFPITPGQTLKFDLYLTFGYGFSAVLADRLDPKYFNPEFNRKAAWKVEVLPPDVNENSTWDESDNTTLHDIHVKVFDWQIGANVNPDLEEKTDIYAASDVLKVGLEIPGMHDEIHELTTPSSGAGTPAAPLNFIFSIANENLLPAGQYTGIVAVYDERSPLEIADGRDYLIHTDDAGKTLNEFEIPAYVTYQTFTATVVSEIFSQGNLIWAKRAGGLFLDEGYAIAALSDDTLFVSGVFRGTSTFGEDETNETTIISATVNPDIWIARYNPDGTLIWAKRAAGSNGRDEVSAITALSDDSTVIVGQFSDEITFGEGEANETTFTDSGSYIARFNPDGTLVWAKRAGRISSIYSHGITALSDDSTVITGAFWDTAIFGEGDPNETTLASAGEGDIFIACYKPDGALAWAKRAGGGGQNLGRAITTLLDDSVVITGNYHSSAIFGEGEPNEIWLTVGRIFIARYNPDGTLAWAKRAGGSRYDEAQAAAYHSNDSIFIAGYQHGDAIFGEGEPNQTTLSGKGVFMALYSNSGMLLWAKKIANSEYMHCTQMLTLTGDSPLITGYFYRTSLILGEGEPNETTLTAAGGWQYREIFIARYNPDGTLEWARSAGGASNDYSYGLTSLSDDSTAITGYFRDSATFGEGEPNETILESAGEQDIFIARYAP